MPLDPFHLNPDSCIRVYDRYGEPLEGARVLFLRHGRFTTANEKGLAPVPDGVAHSDMIEIHAAGFDDCICRVEDVL